MLIVFCGNTGQGKTLIMSALASQIAQKHNLTLTANYKLKNARRIDSFTGLLEAKNGVVAIDEAGVVIDSRCFKDNVKMTQWLVQTRHVGLIVMLTSQAFHQIDKRARDITDYIIMCKKYPDSIILTVIDWVERRVVKKYRMVNPENYYHLYNSFSDMVSIIRPN